MKTDAHTAAAIAFIVAVVAFHALQTEVPKRSRRKEILIPILKYVMKGSKKQQRIHHISLMNSKNVSLSLVQDSRLFTQGRIYKLEHRSQKHPKRFSSCITDFNVQKAL